LISSPSSVASSAASCRPIVLTIQPFARLLLRNLGLAATLRSAGAPLRLPRGADPSLPLALAGVGITLRQAAGLYAALATDGTGGPLRLLADQPDSRPDFLPAPAAHLVADVLTRPLPGFGAQGIAWKTGTSWGDRDAWALGT
jgi:penicillin-binding protein 1C